MSEIAGRTMLITGAASGVGRQLAARAAEAGAALVLWDVDAVRLEAVAGELRARHGGGVVRALAVDLADRAAVRVAAEHTRASAGPIDILVNNAGIVTGRLLPDLSEEAIEATFAVNALALFWTTRAFLPEMIRRNRGHVVTVASAAGLVGVARQTDYAASKHAAVGFDESLRQELRRIAPRVVTTVICPFYIDTGMFAGVKSRVPLLLPILKEARVADRIVRAIRRDERRVILPPLVRLLPVLRVLPTSVFDRALDLFGVNAGMDGFTGRARAAPGRGGAG